MLSSSRHEAAGGARYTMPETGSVSHWIGGLKAGDEVAAARLWQRYYRRLIGLARRQLGPSPRRMADEDDVVLDAFNSLWNAARAGRFPDLRDRDDLWRVIACLTQRRARDQMRGQGRRKRGAGRVLGESALGPRGDDSSQGALGIAGLPGADPTPEQAAETAEAVGRLLEMLGPDLEHVALLKLEGYTNSEIAAAIDRSLATVERRLRNIRALWQGAEEGGGGGGCPAGD